MRDSVLFHVPLCTRCSIIVPAKITVPHLAKKNASLCWTQTVITVLTKAFYYTLFWSNTGLSKKMDGIWNRYNLKSTGRIYTFGVLKCSEEFKVLDLP